MLSVSEDDRKSERATSGISGERDPGEKGRPDPAPSPSSALSESLEQANLSDVEKDDKGATRGVAPLSFNIETNLLRALVLFIFSLIVNVRAFSMFQSIA